jgi:hypothetical protein
MRGSLADASLAMRKILIEQQFSRVVRFVKSPLIDIIAKIAKIMINGECPDEGETVGTLFPNRLE